ncbi:MAG: hypothetical protein HYY23_05545 [Verrucomicrobia bacterium]|nr:hypothetical protein [Verrucomicrobiota bacterium]
MAPEETAHRKLAAIMFTDMVGYTALTQRNEKLALELLEEHRRVLRELFPKFNGREIDTAGDGFLVEFASSLEAARCAIEIQRSLATRNIAVPPEKQIHVRIGIHVGDVVQKDGKLLGDGVNIAARLEPLAEPGGICISVDVARQIQHNLEAKVISMGPAELKNVMAPLEICRILLPWQETIPPATARPKPPLPTLKLSPAGIALAVVLIALVSVWLLFRERLWPVQASERIESLVVLPFENLPRDADQEFFAVGMTELLGSELGKLGAFRKVIYSRQAVAQYKERGGKMIPDIARDFAVDAVLDGTVFREGNQVRILVRLTHGLSERLVWSDNYTRPQGSLLKLQSEVALAIAHQIQLALTPQDRERLGGARDVNPAVIENYFRGRHYLEQWSREGTVQAIKYFRDATQLDTNYAPAYAALVDAYLFSQPDVPPKQANEEARRALTAALAAGESLAEVQIASALMKFQVDWDWAGAEAGFKRALNLNPSFAHAHHIYSHFLMTLGRTNEAFIESLRFLELAPRSPAAHHHMGSFYTMLARQHDLALQQELNALKLDPNYPESFWSQAYARLQKGEYEQAESAAKKAVEVGPDSLIYRARLAHVYAAWGKTNEARIELANLQSEARQKQEYLPAYHVAVIYTALKEYDEALKWLRQALTDNDRSWYITELPIDATFDPLRSDPRFAELLAEMKLPKR